MRVASGRRSDSAAARSSTISRRWRTRLPFWRMSRCTCCVEALDVSVDAYGAESGTLAWRSVATGGVFVGGGIAPKILPALTAGSFMRAFNAKDPLERMVERMPVKVILNAEAGLLGAAVYAASARVAT